ncbi:probable serine/threonine-protein kinase DDB_G0288147 [Condylostylus longicornis]|uniref:probable serine/threonine-protein kinase DDB_G0288147 n=1 Tax=Condylostylus longicornis TaxID=2530218 RepID=UPI00244DA640|nr:probable serine/threonine-protein kinase DDB_G0288147 [Condylostylus longicornis]
MERMWRKVGGFTGRTSKSSTTIQSDTASSAGFGGDNQIQVVAVSGTGNNLVTGTANAVPSSSNNTNNTNNLAVTGRRLAASGDQQIPIDNNGVDGGGGGGISSSFSQHVLHQSTASSERRRRRRRKSRQRTSNRERIFGGFRNESSSNQIDDNCNNAENGATDINEKRNERNGNRASTRDSSLRQRAVAKLRMFNFHLNWDLHMTQCKPCVPRSGNILTRRLCRNRRGEDNELYRSNSFKFERFERKEVNESGTTLQRKSPENSITDFSSGSDDNYEPSKSSASETGEAEPEKLTECFID